MLDGALRSCDGRRGGASSAGPWLRSLFELYVDAQLTMLEASGNLNVDGAAEYAVVLARGLPEAEARSRFYLVDQAGLLREGQEGYTVAGQGYLEMRYGDGHTLKLFRQIVDLPYVNRAFTRMTPNTFESITLARPEDIDRARDEILPRHAPPLAMR